MQGATNFVTANEVAAFADVLFGGLFSLRCRWLIHRTSCVHGQSNMEFSLSDATGERISHFLMNEMQAVMGGRQWNAASSPLPSNLVIILINSSCLLPSWARTCLLFPMLDSSDLPFFFNLAGSRNPFVQSIRSKQLSKAITPPNSTTFQISSISLKITSRCLRWLLPTVSARLQAQTLQTAPL